MCAGVRITFMTKTWKLLSRLLCVRRFRPTDALLGTAKLSDNLFTYFKAVLADNGLDVSKHMLGSTTDAGPDVRRMCETLSGVVSPDNHLVQSRSPQQDVSLRDDSASSHTKLHTGACDQR
jgi:hypothetical protein